MQQNINSIIVILLISTHAIFFLLGYILAKIGQNNGVSNIMSKTISTNSSSAKIDIDDKKYVVNINTDNLEKKYETLGETKKSYEKIDSAINKLKNMKG